MSRARHQHRFPVLPSSGLAAGQEDDRRWFQRNPSATWRLRPVLPGEALALCRHSWALALQAGEPAPDILIPPDEATHVLTVQVRPGVRTRDACRPPPEGAERDVWATITSAKILAQAHAAVASFASTTGEARAEALAWATLPPGASDLSRSMEADLRQKGRALREAMGQTRQ
jgi:hypothetical protein